MNQNNNYSASDIEVLEGLEPVRRRPGMYIGGCDQNAIHHMFCEILDNSMDEAVAGYATKIEIYISNNGIISISDNGRGIPIDPHPKFPSKSALEVILTTLHSGGKFNTNVYATSGGLHGVGISVVNALSEHFIIEVRRGNALYKQSYSKGMPQTDLERSELKCSAKSKKTGTKVIFKPDSSVFGNAIFDPAKLYDIANSKAYLYKGVTIIWNFECSDDNLKDGIEHHSFLKKSDEIHYANGIKDYVAGLVSESERLIPEIFYFEAELKSPQGRVECAFAFNASADSRHRYYCNTIHSPLGGAHENGFRSMLLKALKSYANFINYRNFDKVNADDIMEDITVILSIFIPNPSFQGQTKEKLLSKEAAKLVELTLKDRVEHMLINAPKYSKIILDRVFENANERLKRKAAREVQRKNPLQKLRLPGKLTDCTGKDTANTELLLVEGESAGGTTKQARDRTTQAVLPLRGKFLNVASNSIAKIANNNEISDLITALGCNIGKDFDLKKLRYGKIIIMTDADVDGAHICALILTFFYMKLPELLRQGKIYLVKPPLYRIIFGNKQHYVYSDSEKAELLSGLSKNTKVEVNRFKGLGEMTAKQLKETTMSSSLRTLYKVELADNKQSEESNLVESLMGKKPELRFKFIKENADFGN